MDHLTDIIVSRLLGGYNISNDFKEIEVKKTKKIRNGVSNQLLPYVVANSATKGYKFRDGNEGKKLIVKVLSEEYDRDKSPDENLERFKKYMVEFENEAFTGVYKKK